MKKFMFMLTIFSMVSVYGMGNTEEEELAEDMELEIEESLFFMMPESRHQSYPVEVGEELFYHLTKFKGPRGITHTWQCDRKIERYVLAVHDGFSIGCTVKRYRGNNTDQWTYEVDGGGKDAKEQFYRLKQEYDSFSTFYQLADVIQDVEDKDNVDTDEKK